MWEMAPNSARRVGDRSLAHHQSLRRQLRPDRLEQLLRRRFVLFQHVTKLQLHGGIHPAPLAATGAIRTRHRNAWLSAIASSTRTSERPYPRCTRFPRGIRSIPINGRLRFAFR